MHMMTSSNGNIFRVTGHLCGEFTGPVTRSFDVFFDLCPNRRLSKQSWGWWFETPSCPLWRHRNKLEMLPEHDWIVCHPLTAATLLFGLYGAKFQFAKSMIIDMVCLHECFCFCNVLLNILETSLPWRKNTYMIRQYLSFTHFHIFLNNHLLSFLNEKSLCNVFASLWYCSTSVINNTMCIVVRYICQTRITCLVSRTTIHMVYDVLLSDTLRILLIKHCARWSKFGLHILCFHQFQINVIISLYQKMVSVCDDYSFITLAK